ncbi:chloramphenicol phosphotransferase CPT family protein [Lentzea californiensis]|uniref:chloramphenicol phosphotransferase CPT family protein n=1 Tax=Lentzea californiensis TaxID=438851 RepID=UPI0021645478|nr:chloramphenicol phosphotransferase CPT family protein [Lentzea californiensis]MCR3747849.1 chloramphenicol 3-O phosphotransferase [Lentzea californiensis]
MIIFLNGTSSSGKSSIAEQLLLVLDTPYFHLGVDAFGAMRAVERTLELDGPAQAEVLRRTRAGFHRAVAGMARAGNDVVVDHLLSEPWRLQDCLEVMDGLDVVLVGVHCPPDELERRERARGDRVAGQAAAQLHSVHQHGLYDFEVDTGVNSPHECALAIKEFLGQASGTRAFDELRGRARGHDPSTS